MSSILALDLGTSTGWCVGSAGHHLSGVWNLKPDRFSGGGMRFVKFRSRLVELQAAYPIDLVYYEEVRRHAGTDAAHCYGGLMATLTAWCEVEGIPYEGVPVGSIKKFATGRGNADKKAMIDAAIANGWCSSPISDDEADALALWHLKAADVWHDGVPIEFDKAAA